MKTTLMMAITANGMVAGVDDKTPWSSEEFANFEACVARYGNLIIGRRTLEIMANQGELDLTKQAVVVVVSGKAPAIEGCLHARTPEEALSILKEKGFEIAMIGGGSKLNTAFLQAGLVDELILDIEPFIFGAGIPLFSELYTELNLQLLSCKPLNTHTVTLHYKVLK